MNLSRTVDGTVVPEGRVVSESVGAKLWRWPTKWVPDAVVKSPGLSIVVGLVPFVFWGLLVWWAWDKWGKR